MIGFESTLDPRHTQIWGLIVFDPGKPFKRLAISDDYHFLGAIQDNLSAESPNADVAAES